MTMDDEPLTVLSGPTHFVNARGHRVQEVLLPPHAYWFTAEDTNTEAWVHLSSTDYAIFKAGHIYFDDPEIAFEVYDDDA